MRMYTKYLTVLLAAGLFTCAPEEPETPEPEDPGTEQAIETPEPEKEEETSEFPEQIEETIEIEGMEEPIVLNRYDNPEAGFQTYIPEDFIVEELTGVEGESYKFIVNYDGERNDDVHVEVYLFDEQVTEEPTVEDGNSAFTERIQGMKEVDSGTEWFDWSLREFHQEDETTHAMLGEHNGAYFLMTVHSEPLYSEGFIPRMNKIVEHFYWTDTETYLLDDS